MYTGFFWQEYNMIHREIRVDEGKSEIGSLGFTVPPIDQSRPLAPSLLSVEGVVIKS